jgi:hypothetical protein
MGVLQLEILVPTSSSGSRRLQDGHLLEKINHKVPVGNQDSRQFFGCCSI